MPEVKYCDFNSIQQKQINTRSKLFYNLNPENDVFTMTLKYGIGTKKMPKLEQRRYAARYRTVGIQTGYGRIKC